MRISRFLLFGECARPFFLRGRFAERDDRGLFVHVVVEVLRGLDVLVFTSFAARLSICEFSSMGAAPTLALLSTTGIGLATSHWKRTVASIVVSASSISDSESQSL